jgi:hypothetical protein
MLFRIINLVIGVLIVGFIPALKHGAFSSKFRNNDQTVLEPASEDGCLRAAGLADGTR